MKVLIAIDEPACAEEALKFCANHKWPDNVQFKLMHVISPIMMDMPMTAYQSILESVADDAYKAGKELLEQAKTKLEKLTKAKVEVDVSFGFPWTAITSQAESWQANLLVQGSHCRRGLDRFLCGSVSYDIAAQSPCTIVTLPIAKAATIESA